jgi:hypothetical protein
MKNNTKEENGIVSYLLGQSTEDEQLQIEENFFQRPEFHEHMLAIEEELIRDYIVGELAPKQRALFETHFLNSERRRKKYESARNLTTYLADAYLPQPLPVRSKKTLLARFFGEGNRSLLIQAAGAMTAVLLLAFLGVLWTSRQDLIASGEQIALAPKPEPPVVPITPGAQAAGTQRSRITSISAQPKSSRAEKATSSTLAFFLPIAAVRGGGRDEIKELKIPTKAQAVQLDLSLIEWEYPRYNVSVKTIDGKQVVHRENLTPRKTRKGRVLTVSIPSKLLPDAEFVLNISGVGDAGEPKMIEESFFSIKRE